MKKKIWIPIASVILLAAGAFTFMSLKPKDKGILPIAVTPKGQASISTQDQLIKMGFTYGLTSKETAEKKIKYSRLGLQYVTQDEIAAIIDSHTEGEDFYKRVIWTTIPASEYKKAIPANIQEEIVRNYNLIKEDIPDDNNTVRILGPIQYITKPDPIALVSVKGGGYVFIAKW